MLNIFSKLVFFLLIFSSMTNAQLVPIDERELSNAIGQAFINIDHSSDVNNSLDFTKITFGLDIKTSLNADLLELGKYDVAGKAAGSADIKITDFALGHIDESGSIVPFEIADPFIELAFDNDSVTGKQNLAGVRVGFGGALGKLSGNIEYLTGNIDIGIRGLGKSIYDKANTGQDILLWFAGVSDNSVLTAEAELVNKDTGLSDPFRAQHVGMVNGQNLSCVENCGPFSFLLDLDFTSSQGCGVLGIDTCFPLTNFKSLDIGNNGQKSEGLFVSFQTKNIAWKDGSNSTTASRGAFINIPNGGITVNFDQAFNGIPRSRTRYLDPYFGGR
ncbi:MAG: hypothetical protein V7765_08170 [Oleispira sp.]